MRRRILAGVAVCVTVGMLMASGATLASAASTQKGGAIKVWVTPSQGTTTVKHPGKVLFTGAIGDHGLSVNANATGKPQKKKSSYKLLKLKHGSMLVNVKTLNTALTAAFTKAAKTINPTNCSIAVSANGAVPILKGTGAYAGVSGTVTFAINFAVLAAKTKSGKCTLKTTTPALDTYASFIGTGTASYS
jgi:hypothetical protein